MADELRVGVIGGGGIVRSRHMPGLSKIEGVKVTAVCNRRRESAEQFAKDYGVEKICDDWHQIVDDPQIDIVWIGTWPYMHCPVTVAALEAGKHVFCQARMCMNLDEARKMVEAAEKHPDLVTMICPPPHGMAGDRVMRRLLEQERFCGQVLQVRLTALSGGLLNEEAPLHWRKDERLSGRNVLALGIYIEVLHRWLGYHKRVMADFDTYVTERRDPATGEMHKIAIPDAVRILGRYEAGAGAAYHLSGLCDNSPDETLEIYGSEGTIVYNFTQDKIFAAKRGQKELQEVPFGSERREWSVEQDFIHAVRTGDKSRIEPTFQDGLKYMEFLEAVWLSAQQGKAIDLPIA